MNLVSHLRTALEVLLQHRVRSGLTLMGITIGISSTVVMLALGRGVQDQIEQSFSRAGVTLLTVIARTPPGVPESTRSRELYWEDYDALVAPGRIPHLVDAAPLASSMTEVRWRNRQVRVRLLGVTAAYEQLANLRLASGEFLSDEDDRSMRLVAVLGSRLASDLYTQGAYLLRSQAREAFGRPSASLLDNGNKRSIAARPASDSVTFSASLSIGTVPSDFGARRSLP